MDEPANRPLPRLDATVSAHQRRESRPRRRPCLRWGCIALLVLAFLILAAAIAVRVYIRKDLTPEDLREIRAAETEIIQLSPEWHRPAPTPSPELVESRRQFSETVEQIRAKHEDVMFGDFSDEQDMLLNLRQGKPVPADKQEAFAKFLQDVQPLIDDVSNTVSLPGYIFELGPLYTTVNEFLYAQIFAKYASIVALHQAQQGNCAAAFETALLPIQFLKRPANSTAISHLIAVAVSSISSHSTYAIADQCSDTLALKRGLEMMTELRSAAYPGDLSHWRYGDTIGILTHAAGTGYPVNLEPQTLVSFSQQATQVHYGEYHRWVIENLPADDPRVEAAREYLESDTVKQMQNIDTTTDSLSVRLQTAIGRQVLGMDPMAWVITKLASANYAEAEARTSTSLAMYDLTRIHLARRLVELEPSATTITAYLLPVPNDPFTGAPFPSSEQLNKHYSPGPDNHDHQTAIQYDATNGTFSSGDVWMEIR